MKVADQHFSLLYNHEKRFMGAYLSPELWDLASRELAPILEKALDALAPEKPKLTPEPMKNWADLVGCWDYKYPLPMDVTCPACGSATDNWQADEPRKFRLTSAHLGGLASFACQSCQARVVKKHFRDHVAVECTSPDGTKTVVKIPKPKAP